MLSYAPVLKRAVIITPVFRSELDVGERRSLDYLRATLSQYERTIIAPPAIDLSAFEGFQIVRFPARFFRSVDSYNRLMLTRRFYRRFRDYEFLLVYQLDALVFRDELEQWCSAGYDYIGAPILFDTSDQTFGLNGGFSLRRTRAFLDVVEGNSKGQTNRVTEGMLFMRRNILTRTVKRLLLWLHFKGVYNVLPILVLKSGYHEDMFWSTFAPLFSPGFKVAPPEVAQYFAFEAQPSRLYQENNRQLPFGCHAWERWEPEFWAAVLPNGGRPCPHPD